MEIQHTIVHSIEKNNAKAGARLDQSQEVLDVTDTDVIKLVTELNNRYKTKSQSYGTFDPDAGSTEFHEEIAGFLKNPTEKNFITFSQHTVEELRTEMDGTAAKGGYIVYASYFEQRPYVSVFIVRDTKGVLFTKKDGSFKLNEAKHIDFEKMSMACRVNKEIYQAKNGRYLSFIGKKTDATSKFFTNWIGASDAQPNTEDTTNLYNLFKTLPPPVDENGNEQDQDTFLAKVYSHISALPQRQVNIPNLSSNFFKDVDFLTSEIEKSGLLINTEFKADPTKLKAFAQIRAKAGKIELNFPQNLFRSVVRISETNKGQIIIDSPELAAQVSQLANK